MRRCGPMWAEHRVRICSFVHSLSHSFSTDLLNSQLEDIKLGIGNRIMSKIDSLWTDGTFQCLTLTEEDTQWIYSQKQWGELWRKATWLLFRSGKLSYGKILGMTKSWFGWGKRLLLQWPAQLAFSFPDSSIPHPLYRAIPWWKCGSLRNGRTYTGHDPMTPTQGDGQVSSSSAGGQKLMKLCFLLATSSIIIFPAEHVLSSHEAPHTGSI